MNNKLVLDNIIKRKIENKCKNENLTCSRKKLDTYDFFIKNKNIKNAIIYTAKLNVPLLPKTKQVVLGTTKYLLPYFCLTDYFYIFVVNTKIWNINLNNSLINIICKLNEKIIRLVTTPKDMIDNNNKLRVTAIELCILFQNNYEIYKLINNEQLELIDNNTIIYL